MRRLFFSRPKDRMAEFYLHLFNGADAVFELAYLACQEDVFNCKTSNQQSNSQLGASYGNLRVGKDLSETTGR